MRRKYIPLSLVILIVIMPTYLLAQSYERNTLNRNHDHRRSESWIQPGERSYCLTPRYGKFQFELSEELQIPKNPSYETIPLSPQLNKQTSGSWISLGPEGGWIDVLIMHPTDHNILYAQSYSNIYQSSNGGTTWEILSRLPVTLYAFDIDNNDPSIFYGVTGTDFYKTINGGSTWRHFRISDNWISSPRIHVCPTNSDIIYVGGFYYSNYKWTIVVYRSTNGGTNWTPYEVMPDNYSGAYCHSFAVNPLNSDELYIGGRYYDEMDYLHPALFKTTDAGVSWTDVSNGLDYIVYDVVIDPENSQKIYVCNYSNVFRSQDGGINWQRNNGYAYAYKLAIDPNNTNILYGGYYACIFKSNDGGVNWNYYFSGLKGQCNSIVVDHTVSSNLYYSSPVGVFKSSNSGSDWFSINSGIIASQITSMGIAPGDPKTIYIESYYDAVYKTMDSGNSWSKLPEFTSCGDIGALAVHNSSPNIAYALEESG